MTREEIEKYFVESTGFGIDKIKSFMTIVDKALEEKGEQIKRLKADNEKLKKEIIEIEKVSDFKWEENQKLKEEKKMLIKRLKTFLSCGYCKHQETEPDDLCIPCLSGIKCNWKVEE